MTFFLFRTTFVTSILLSSLWYYMCEFKNKSVIIYTYCLDFDQKYKRPLWGIISQTVIGCIASYLMSILCNVGIGFAIPSSFLCSELLHLWSPRCDCYSTSGNLFCVIFCVFNNFLSSLTAFTIFINRIWTNILPWLRILFMELIL